MEMDDFLYEQLAHTSRYQLQLSSVCNGRCVFCSNKQNPFEIKRIGFRSMESIEKGINLINPDTGVPLAINDALPGRISEGEAFLHPKLFEILKMIRRKHHHRIQVNTNGILLTEEFISKLAPFGPWLLSISYHSNNVYNWCKIFDLSEKQFKIAQNSFSLLKRYDLDMDAVIVPLPNLVGYKDIEETIAWLSDRVSVIIFYLPGFTNMTDPDVKAMLDTDYIELGHFINDMRKKYSARLVNHSDMVNPTDFYPTEVMDNTHQSRFKNVLWMFSESVYDRAKLILEESSKGVNNNHYAWKVKNHTYGGNIICSGLLMVNDFRIAIKEALEEFKSNGIIIDLLILPVRRSRDSFEDDLMGENHNALFKEFNIPIWYA